MNMTATSKKSANRGVKSMRVIVNKEKKKMAEPELRKGNKELERERKILVSMEQISHGKQLFVARSHIIENETESEREILKGMLEREVNKN